MNTADTIPAEERRLYEITYAMRGTAEEEESASRDLRDIVETHGGMVQDSQPPKKYHGFSRGYMRIIAAPSLVARIESAIRALSSPALTQTLLARWEKTAPQGRGSRHPFIRKPAMPQKEEERRDREIDKQIDELLEKQL